MSSPDQSIWHDGEALLAPDIPLEQSLKSLPARWAVYLMSDAEDRPVQLLSVKNLRASVKRRLSENSESISRRVDYRGLVRRVRWKRVDGALESDMAYLDVARTVFPQSYRSMVTLRPASWLHIDPRADFPRWTRIENPLLPRLTSPSSIVLGPLQEKTHAARLIELLEDSFDLCRYYHILTQAPEAVACAYKDMGKCPAPCDGSVSMQQYRLLADWSIRTLIDPTNEIEEQTERMREAAAEMRFETAGKIKLFVEALKALRAGDDRFVRPFNRFGFVAMQPGPTPGKTRLIICTPAGVTELAGLIADPIDVLGHLDLPTEAMQPDLEKLCIIIQHLFNPKTTACFLAVDQLTTKSLSHAYRTTCKQPADTANDEEGIVREAGILA